MSEFNLTGKTLSIGDKWGAEITLTTPDGKTTTIESGGACNTDTEAVELLKMNMERILKEFKRQDVEIVSLQEGAMK